MDEQATEKGKIRPANKIRTLETCDAAGTGGHGGGRDTGSPRHVPADLKCSEHASSTERHVLTKRNAWTLESNLLAVQPLSRQI
jgi:hypothetical protein